MSVIELKVYQIGYSNNIKKGMSGGPILNSEGKVIGVNGIHAYPLWGDPYRYEDGTPPSEAMRAAMKHLSWGIPIQTFAQLVPQYASPEAMPGDAMPSTVSPIADVMNEIARQITVLIQGKKGNGSGFIIAKQGNTYTVLTNEHVVRGKNEFEIVTPDGARYPVTNNEENVRTLVGVDLAVVQFDSDKDYRVARLGNYDLRERFTNLTQDRYVFVSGWPGSDNGQFSRLFTAGLLFNKTLGLWLAKDSYSLTYGYGLVYTNIAKPEVSGGPVLDVSGRVVGIHGRAEREFNLDARRNIYLGYSLGVPVRSFVNLATKVGIAPEWLKIDTSSPPSLTEQEKDSILETLVAEAKPKDSNDAIDWLNYGNQLWRIDRGEEAIAAFDRAIELMPSLYQVWYARGIALSYNEEQEAIESFDRAIQGKEYFGPAWRWRGIVLSSVKQYEDALASLEKAISLDRKDSAAHFWRIVALKKLNRYKDGLDACNEAIESPLDSRIKYLF
ncbi:MAG: trypsin-like peptidase domain-containing protein [Hormoscilla sp. SP12CHS1]|nr:trypsin-like peptidase domain-containing protein [Hormoscilla sp. SP12CHS1]